jgi:hypothetical protein
MSFFEEVEYAERTGSLRPADPERDGFSWRLIPPGSKFWHKWNADKAGMKAPGFRVTKHAHDGSWMVCREAVPAPVSEPNQTTAQIIQFPVSRIVRHIRNGQPIADAGADAGNAAA